MWIMLHSRLGYSLFMCLHASFWKFVCVCVLKSNNFMQIEGAHLNLKLKISNTCA